MRVATGLAGGSLAGAERIRPMRGSGGSVDTAGDVNGDGYSDIIAGAAWYDNV